MDKKGLGETVRFVVRLRLLPQSSGVDVQDWYRK